ncbi:sulfate adenylyltransferase subunit CysN [Terriglobus sp. 2YAB30_2]|uniref:sulfate adenylyltransferase subunit CysN n=2 Tax=unclassified Terriglobus TaxID=2628988 RepID=UPI003F9A7EDA
MATASAHTDFRVFLDSHLDRELLRFTTAGSVDDGKSTLIGRLLHDTKSVYEDQLASVAKSRVNRAGNGRVDLSLLTDGLRAEREQGITIDVAYRYFATAKRKFIIADTPGHEQYTRNMATGASTADVAIVLVDGSKGILPQSRRHSFIASLLGIPHVVAAVNKMDLVSYDEAKFRAIEADFRALAKRLGLRNVQIIPVSALEGDNVVTSSTNMPWYSGPTLLEYLETVPLREHVSDQPLRFPVQLVVRPDRTFRGFAGQVAGGTVRAGQHVVALPSGRRTQVKRIVTWDGDLKVAGPGESVTLELTDEIDLSRGEMLISPDAHSNSVPTVSTAFGAKVVWMHEEPLEAGKTYLLKQTSRVVRAEVKRIAYRVDVNSLEHLDATELKMNDIAEVEFETNLPLFFDAYRENRVTGAAILIDPLSNATVGALMIDRAVRTVTRNDLPALLAAAHIDLAERLRELLAAAGHRAVVLHGFTPDEVPVAVRALQLAGVLAIVAGAVEGATVLDATDDAGLIAALAEMGVTV